MRFLNYFCLYQGRTTYNFNKITKHFKLFISLFLLTILGCATTHYQLYDGPPLPQNEVSILFVPPEKITFFSDHPPSAEVILYEIDGKKGSNFRPSSLQARQGIWVYNSRIDNQFRIEMLPGRHVLRVGLIQLAHHVTYYSTSTQILEFEAKPGCVYTIELDIDKDSRTWKARVIKVQ